MPADWERIATFGSMVEADLACARLEQAGIEARSATDVWDDWVPSGLRSVEWDADGDGVPDGTDTYQHGVITRSLHTPGGGRPEREDVYEAGRLREIHLIDEAGERRLLVRFDALGRLVDGRP